MISEELKIERGIKALLNDDESYDIAKDQEIIIKVNVTDENNNLVQWEYRFTDNYDLIDCTEVV